MNESYIKETTIPGLWFIERPVFPDERGFFHEVFRLPELEKKIGFKFTPVQFSHSCSRPKVIRAIHSEDWNKLVYPVNGKVFIAIVDLRPDRETFGKVATFFLDQASENSQHQALFISKGLGNSLCVLGETAVDYVYLVDEYWDGTKARGIIWNDPDLAIDWPIKDPIISKRDSQNPTLREVFPERF